MQNKDLSAVGNKIADARKEASNTRRHRDMYNAIVPKTKSRLKEVLRQSGVIAVFFLALLILSIALLPVTV